MANYCNPYPKPAFIERNPQTDRGQYVGMAAEAAWKAGIERPDSDVFLKKIQTETRRHMEEVMPYAPEAVVEYLKKEGWLQVDPKVTKMLQDAGIDQPYLKGNKNLSPLQMGIANRTMKLYLEKAGGAIDQQARIFLAKVAEGQDAVVEGLQFAQQMQHVSKLTGAVLGWDQQLSLGLSSQRGLTRGLADDMASGVYNASAKDLMGATPQMADDTDALANVFRDIARNLADPERAVEGVNSLIGLARRVEFLGGDVRGIAKLSSGLEIAGRSINSVMINGLLSGPATFAANAAGAAWVPARAAFQLLGSAFLAPMNGQAARQVAVEAVASLAAMREAWRDATVIGWRAFKSGKSLYGHGAQRAITGANAAELIAQMQGKPMGTGIFGESDAFTDTIDVLGKFIEAPSRLLLGADEFAKHLSLRGSVAARGVRRAAAQGIDLGDEAALREFIRNEAHKAFDLLSPDEAQKYRVDSLYEYAGDVMDEAARGTFQEENTLAGYINRITTTVPALKPFMPFVRTPLNILKQGFVDSTGVGALVRAGQLALDAKGNPTAALLSLQQELLKDPAESARLAGQIAFTTGLAATFYGMAMDGQIIGGGPGRWTPEGRQSDAQRAWQQMINEQGLQPYSLVLGGQGEDRVVIPFARLGEPISIVLRMAADLGMASGYFDQDDRDGLMAAYAGIMASALYQGSFLEGINQMSEVLSTGLNPTGMSQTARNYVSTFTPFGGLLNYAKNVSSPYRQLYDKDVNIVDLLTVHEEEIGNSILAKALSRMPGNVGGQPIHIDQLTGRPVPSIPGVGPNGANPANVAIPFLPRIVNGQQQVGPWEAIYKITGRVNELKPTNLKLTVAEQQALNAEMASVMVEGKTVAQRVMAFYHRADVQDYIKARAATPLQIRTKIETELSDILREHHQAGLQVLVGKTPNLYERMKLNEGMREAARRNDLQGAGEYRDAINNLLELAR